MTTVLVTHVKEVEEDRWIRKLVTHGKEKEDDEEGQLMVQLLTQLDWEEEEE